MMPSFLFPPVSQEEQAIASRLSFFLPEASAHVNVLALYHPDIHSQFYIMASAPNHP